MNSDYHRNFPAFEFTSLSNKFKQLWLTGKEAKLEFETCEGQAWGSLHVCLGEYPSQPLPHPQEHQYGHETPAKRRRRERRKATRLAELAAVKAAANGIPEDGAVEATEADEEQVVITEEVATTAEDCQSY